MRLLKRSSIFTSGPVTTEPAAGVDSTTTAWADAGAAPAASERAAARAAARRALPMARRRNQAPRSLPIRSPSGARARMATREYRGWRGTLPPGRRVGDPGRTDDHPAPVVSAADALERLRQGNLRFVSGERSLDTLRTHARRVDLAVGQSPFAIILGCSDSRVPAEIVFDQGLGDLFVIRVVGNIVASSQVDSVEFAATTFGTRLVVVLGHSRCGAILATLEELRQPAGERSRSLRSIVDRVRPSVEPLLATELRHDPDALARAAVRANIRGSANHLRHGSALLEQLIRRDGLLVVGAEYSLETGVVEFFDGVTE